MATKQSKKTFTAEEVEQIIKERLAENKAQSKPEKKLKPKKNLEKKNDLLSMETVTLVKDDYRYTDDVTVTYNGVNYQIKRGIPVQVPKAIKLILEDSARQQTKATEFSKGLENEFYQKTDRVARGLKVN